MQIYLHGCPATLIHKYSYRVIKGKTQGMAKSSPLYLVSFTFYLPLINIDNE